MGLVIQHVSPFEGLGVRSQEPGGLGLVAQYLSAFASWVGCSGVREHLQMGRIGASKEIETNNQ